MSTNIDYWVLGNPCDGLMGDEPLLTLARDEAGTDVVGTGNSLAEIAQTLQADRPNPDKHIRIIFQNITRTTSLFIDQALKQGVF